MSTPQEPTQPEQPYAAPPAQPGYVQPEQNAPEQPYAQPAPQAPPAYAAAPAYGQPQGYAQAPGYDQQPPTTGGKPSTWMNITSLVLSILGMGLLGVIFGHLGISAAKKGRADYKGLGIAGLILGYVQIVLGIVFTIIIIATVNECANDPACVDWWTELSES